MVSVHPYFAASLHPDMAYVGATLAGLHCTHCLAVTAGPGTVV